MSVFKSAMGYFSSGGANGSSENDFVGQFVEIGNMKLRVKKVIAEGESILDTYVLLFFVVASIVLKGFGLSKLVQAYSMLYCVSRYSLRTSYWGRKGKVGIPT